MLRKITVFYVLLVAVAANTQCTKSASATSPATSTGCEEKSFCNYDETTSGFCETCSSIVFCETAFFNTQEGEDECSAVCGGGAGSQLFVVILLYTCIVSLLFFICVEKCCPNSMQGRCWSCLCCLCCFSWIFRPIARILVHFQEFIASETGKALWKALQLLMKVFRGDINLDAWKTMVNASDRLRRGIWGIILFILWTCVGLMCAVGSGIAGVIGILASGILLAMAAVIFLDRLFDTKTDTAMIVQMSAIQTIGGLLMWAYPYSKSGRTAGSLSKANKTKPSIASMLVFPLMFFSAFAVYPLLQHFFFQTAGLDFHLQQERQNIGLLNKIRCGVRVIFAFLALNFAFGQLVADEMRSMTKTGDKAFAVFSLICAISGSLGYCYMVYIQDADVKSIQRFLKEKLKKRNFIIKELCTQGATLFFELIMIMWKFMVFIVAFYVVFGIFFVLGFFYPYINTANGFVRQVCVALPWKAATAYVSTYGGNVKWGFFGKPEQGEQPEEYMTQVIAELFILEVGLAFISMCFGFYESCGGCYADELESKTVEKAMEKVGAGSPKDIEAPEIENDDVPIEALEEESAPTKKRHPVETVF